MGLGNGNSKTGDKGSNYSYELKSLQGLQQSLTLLAGLATEGTLLQVLAAIIASDQDIEILLVRDEAVGNGNPVLKQVTNYETGVPVVSYENVDGTPYVPAPNPVPVYVYLDPSAVLNLMLAELLDQGLTLDSIEVTTANTLIELLDQGLSLDGLNSLITTLNSTVATEITLAQVLVELQAINIDLDGLSLEATQQLVLTALNTVISNTTGLATEVTLAAVLADTTSIDTRLTPAVRTHNTLSENAVGVLPAGSMSGSVLNVGPGAGVWNGTTIPAGVSIPWGAIGNRDTYGAITYDGTGTVLIIEYTT